MTETSSWGSVLVGGTAIGLLATYRVLDAVLWRLTVRALPWIALAVVLVVVVLVARWLWRKGQGW